MNCLPHDNPFNSPSYLASLTQENLGDWAYHSRVLGDWHYESGQDDLFIESDLIDCKSWPLRGIGEKFLTIDVGGSGSDADRSVAMLWQGFDLIRSFVYRGLDTVTLAAHIRGIIADNNIKIKNVAIDSIGIGQGVADQLSGCIQFKGSNSRMNNEGYSNQRDQTYYKAAELVRSGEVRIGSVEGSQELITELCAHKQYRTDNGGLARVTPKIQVKASLGGKSPDYADAFTMRFWFCYRTAQGFAFDFVPFAS